MCGDTCDCESTGTAAELLPVAAAAAGAADSDRVAVVTAGVPFGDADSAGALDASAAAALPEAV